MSRVVGDRFVLLEAAGSGATGTVWRAIDRQSGAEAGVKLLADTSARALARLFREARAIDVVEHPGVVGYIAHGTTEDGIGWLAMDWVEGTALDAHLRQVRRMEIGDALLLTGRLAAALGAAHAAGVIHRDLKPGNVILEHGEPGRAKLLDFGLARTADDAMRLTDTGAIVGTPYFMAPEQILSTPNPDPRIDVFALGSLLYACVMGRPPFRGGSAVSIMAAILRDDLPWCYGDAPPPPPEVEDLLVGLLARDPTARLPDGRAVAAAIDMLAPTMRDASPLGARSAPRGAAISSDERRFSGRIVVAHGAGAADAVALVAQAHDLEPEALDTTATLLMVDGRGDASGIATQAARCALELAARVTPAPRVAVSIGWTEGHALTTGQEAARALRLLDGPGGTVRVDARTAELLAAGFELVGGAEYHLLVAERALAPTVLGREVPFVGRRRELAVLQATWEDVIREDGATAHAVLVTAVAGLGKTRLVATWLDGLRGDAAQTLVLRGRADAHGAADAWGLAAQLLPRSGEAGEAALDEPFLREIMGVEPRASGTELVAARADSRLMADQVRRAWLRWLTAQCANHAVVIVLDDLHRGDLPTVRLVDEALRRLHEAPLMIVASARPDLRVRFPTLWRERAVTELCLSALPQRDGRALARALLSDADVALAEPLAERAEGHPLFLEELARWVALRPEGRHRTLPETVLVMVQDRLKDVPAEARRVARAGAILGESFSPREVLELIGGAAQGGLAARALAMLTEREVLIERADGRYAFTHALWREAAYEQLPEEDRLAGHLAAAEWLEGEGRRDPLVIGDHYRRGGAPERAVAYDLRAARAALDGGDLDAATELATRGLDGVSASPLRAELLLVRAAAARWRMDTAAARQDAEAARDAGEPGSETWLGAIGELVMLLGRAADVDGVERAMADALEATADAATLTRQACLALLRGAAQLAVAGRLEPARAVVRRIEARGAATVASEPGLAARLLQARTLSRFIADDMVTSLRDYERAADLLDEAGARREAAIQRLNAGHRYTMFGDYARAEALLLSGDLDGARREVERAQQLLTEFRPLQVLVCAVLAAVEVEAGRLDLAVEAGRRGLELVAEFDAPEHSDSVLRLAYARALHRTGRQDEARDVLAEGWRGVQARGAPVRGTALEACFDAEPTHAAMRALVEEWGLP